MVENILPNKDLGQHWLNDQYSLDAIVESADVRKGDVILEVGPGMGSLTEKLVKKASRVLAVEFDHALLKGLQSKFNDTLNLELINQDIRKFDLSSLPPSYKVVANIPYYLTSYLIRLFSESSNPPKLAVLLVQQEVAQRIAAQPGQLSILGVVAQVYWDISLGLIVPAELFFPPPKVNSQIVILKRRDNPFLPNGLEKEFFQTVKIGFSQKRKTLINSLSGGYHFNKEVAKKIISDVGLDSNIRPQELTLEEWSNLTSIIVSINKNK